MRGEKHTLQSWAELLSLQCRSSHAIIVPHLSFISFGFYKLICCFVEFSLPSQLLGLINVSEHCCGATRRVRTTWWKVDIQRINQVFSEGDLQPVKISAWFWLVKICPQLPNKLRPSFLKWGTHLWKHAHPLLQNDCAQETKLIIKAICHVKMIIYKKALEIM